MRAWRSQLVPFGIAASGYIIGTAVGIVNELARAAAAVACGRGHGVAARLVARASYKTADVLGSQRLRHGLALGAH